MTPARLTKDQLADVLSDMLIAIREDDSFEGRINYTTLGYQYDDLGPGEFEVTAVYRIGNSMGQGGVRMVGDPS